MLAWIPHNCLFLKQMACHVPIHQISERRYYLRSHVDKEKVKKKLLISWKKCGISSKVEETLSVLENIVTQNDCLISTIQYLIKKFDQCYISTFTPSRMKTFTSVDWHENIFCQSNRMANLLRFIRSRNRQFYQSKWLSENSEPPKLLKRPNTTIKMGSLTDF